MASCTWPAGRVCIYMQTIGPCLYLHANRPSWPWPGRPGACPAGPGQAQVDQAQLAVARSTRPAGHGPWPVLPGKCCTAATRHARMTSWRGSRALCTAAWPQDPRPRSLVGTALAWPPAPGFWAPARASQALARFHTMDDDRKMNWQKQAPFGYNHVSKKIFCKFLKQLANDP